MSRLHLAISNNQLLSLSSILSTTYYNIYNIYNIAYLCIYSCLPQYAWNVNFCVNFFYILAFVGLSVIKRSPVVKNYSLTLSPPPLLATTRDRWVGSIPRGDESTQLTSCLRLDFIRLVFVLVTVNVSHINNSNVNIHISPKKCKTNSYADVISTIIDEKVSL